MYPTIMKAWTPIVPLYVSQEFFDDLGKVSGIPDTWRETKDQSGCLEE